MCVIDLVEAENSWRRAAIAHRDAHREQPLQAGKDAVHRDVPEALVRILQESEPKIVGTSSGLAEYMGASEGSKPVLVAPLVSRGEPLGVIMAIAPASREFTSDDLPLMAELARQAAVAIDNARLYQSSQQAVSAREEVLAIVSHDLRNPLNAFSMSHVSRAASVCRSSPSPSKWHRCSTKRASCSRARRQRARSRCRCTTPKICRACLQIVIASCRYCRISSATR
jgi:GAF domain-containing protein